MQFLDNLADTRKYSKFQWRVEWVQYAATITDTDAKGLFFRSIMEYGLMCEYPEELKGEPLCYFREVIIPDLDNQHQQADITGSKRKQDERIDTTAKPR